MSLPSVLPSLDFLSVREIFLKMKICFLAGIGFLRTIGSGPVGVISVGSCGRLGFGDVGLSVCFFVCFGCFTASA